MKRPSLRTFVLLIIIAAIVLSAGYLLIEREVPLSVHPRYKAFYRYINGLYEIHYHRIVVDDGEIGKWTIINPKSGWNEYKGFYPNGTIRDKGVIWIEYHDTPPEPLPDLHKVSWGEYYRPDGTLGTEIKDQTGIQTYWHPNGNKIWEMEIKGGKTLKKKAWNESGVLIVDE